MKSIRKYIEKKVEEAFVKLSLDEKYGRVLKSQRPDLCQFQCNGAMAAAKNLGKNPRDIGQSVVDILKECNDFKDVSLVGAGFINISLKDEIISQIISSGSIAAPSVNQTVVIDFAGPNVAKPMHVGHLRSAIIGDCLRRLFKYLGGNVIADNHLGDWGTQMGMLICKSKGKYPESVAQLELMYTEASKESKQDAEFLAAAVKATDELQQGRQDYKDLWMRFVDLSVEALKKDFEVLGVEFDYWLGESFYSEKMKEVVDYLKREGFAKESEGAITVDVRQANDTKEYPPVLLVKSSGGFLYATSDIATIDYRVKEFKPNRIIYVVDKRQSLHFEQVFRAVKMSGIAPAGLVLEHIGFGTVNGSDGKPYKTREGGVMKLADLIDLVITKAKERAVLAGLEGSDDIAKMIGISALKFADLQNHRLSDYVFDVDKFTSFEGKTGPYMLYTAVRIKSIIRKVKSQKAKDDGFIIVTDNDRDLLLELGRVNDVLEAAAADCAPNYICDYAYGLAQEFNRFYKSSPILHEEDPQLAASRLVIAQKTLSVIELTMGILGIEIPERM